MSGYYGSNNGSSSGFYGGSQGSGFHQSQGYSQQTAPNPQSWQAPTSFQKQNQQQPQQASILNPAAAAAISAVTGSMGMGQGGMPNEAVMQSIGTLGQNFISQGTARMIPGLESTLLVLRHYFAVDNRYVVRKMRKVLFPFISPDWQRQIKQLAGPETPMIFEQPVTDTNAPDLYVPIMSLITYVLLCALCYGTAGHFNPEVIPDVTSKCFLTQLMEVLLIRLGFYLMQAPVAILDLFSYTGYKYVGLCLNLLIGMLASRLQYGTTAYYVCFLWTASAAAFFMFKTMANNIPMQVAANGPKREMVVLGIAGAQCASMWFVGQTKFL